MKRKPWKLKWKIIKYGKALAIGLAIFVIGVGSLGLFSVKVLGRPAPMILGQGAAIVLSGSMEPAISVNDMVVYSKRNHYGAGDIVVFCDDGMTSVHRIIKRCPDQVITKGDANNAFDEPISEKQILGKVVMILPKAGVLFEEGTITALALVFLGIGYWDYRKRGRKEGDLAYER